MVFADEGLRMPRKIFGLLVWLMSLGAIAAASDHPWTKVVSPHFTVVSESGEGSARKVAAQFEQIRWVLMQIIPGLSKDPNTPVLVVAVPDQPGMESLVGPMHRRAGGMFMHGRDHNFAIVRLDSTEEWLDHTVIHEYVHLLTSVNVGRLPTWVDEGIADFYGQSDLSRDRVKFGRPIVRYAALVRERGMIPYSRLFVLTENSPEYRSDSAAAMVYAESWAIVHYLLLGDNGVHSRQLGEYISLLQRGKGSLVAAKQVFGDLDKLQDAVLHYMKQFSAPYRWVNLPREDFSKQLTVSTMSLSETESWRASIVATHDAAKGKELAEAAIAAEPKLAPAHETLALVSLKEGNYPQARGEFEKALALDPNLYLSNYFHARLLLRDQGDATLAEAELRKAAANNPNYAPALLALARLLAARSDTLKEALQLGWQAVQREDMRVGYHLAFGYMLLRAGKAEQAELAAKHASDMYADAVEKDEAARLLALAQQCEVKHDCSSKMEIAPFSPAKVDEDQAAQEDKNEKTVGTITAAHCSKEERRIHLETANGKAELSLGPTAHIGAPDTFWVGSEYFNCVALVGETALVIVKKDPVPQLTRLEVLDKY